MDSGRPRKPSGKRPREGEEHGGAMGDTSMSDDAGLRLSILRDVVARYPRNHPLQQIGLADILFAYVRDGIVPQRFELVWPPLGGQPDTPATRYRITDGQPG